MFQTIKKLSKKIGTYTFLVFAVAIVLFSAKVANADINSNYWIQNSLNSLATNTSGGLANADIHVAHCYIGIGSTIACGSVGSSPSIGGAITGGTAKSVLFVNPNNVIAQDNPAFVYDSTAKQLSVGGCNAILKGQASEPLTLCTTINNYSGAYIQNKSNGDTASTDLLLGNDMDTTNFGGHYLDLGEHGSGFVGNPASNGIIGTVSINAGGTAYQVGDVLTLVGGSSDGTVTVAAVSGGVVTSVFISANGTNYVVASGLSTTGGHGTGAKINVVTLYDLTLYNANDSFVWAGGVGGNLVLNTDTAGTVMKFAVGGTSSTNEMMRLTSTGLGIGTTTPAYSLDIVSPTTGTMARFSNSSGTLFFNANGINEIISRNGANNAFTPLQIRAAGSGFGEYLDTSGNLGLLTTAPTHTLTLGSTSSGIAQYNTVDQTTNWERNRQYWSGNVFNIANDTGGTGTARNMHIATNNANIDIGAGSGLSAVSGIALYKGSTGTAGNVEVYYTPNGSSGVQSNLLLDPTIQQTGTAGYRALHIAPFEQTVGSGARYLIDAGTSSAAGGGYNGGSYTQKFYVDQSGGVGISSQLRIGSFSNNSIFGINRSGWSVPAWGTRGIATSIEANTYNDSSSATGTVATNTTFTSLGIPTLTSTNASVVYTNASNLYIDGAPTASGNASITNSYALYVNAGTSIFNGASQLVGGIATRTGTPDLGAFFAVGNSGMASTVQTQNLFGGASTVYYRAGFSNNASSAIVGANANYANAFVGSAPFTTSGSGTNAWLTNFTANTLGAVTSGGATVTNTATAYIGAASAGVGSSNNYALYVNGAVASAATQTVVNCSTSGTVTFSEPFDGPSYKQVIAYENACLGTASYTYPRAFTNTPDSLGADAAKHTSISTTATTVTGTTTTGFSQLYGY